MNPAARSERPRWLNTESLRLTLTLGGRFAGEQVWQTQPEKFGALGAGYQTRVQTDFGGVLPAVRKVQVSRYLADGTSLSYAESDGRNKPHFEVQFDAATALITLRQHQDEAAAPLLVAHYDPVSLVMALRGPAAPTELWRAALTGGAVHVQPLPEAEIAGLRARAFYLRPGGAYVASELEAPYRLLRLVQPTDFGPVDASLQPEARRKDGKEDGRSEKADKPRRRRA
ncbi:hypothetical protein [Deinococcus irradiatisoli]|uniref:hypothetical protein n=1 Tax=Deinococcus irradiatisoli TaxID=2202254 RepID=UPI0015E8755A|nr:hypothetical protein [Deinococcus irradiatisoli]